MKRIVDWLSCHPLALLAVSWVCVGVIGVICFYAAMLIAVVFGE